MLVSAWEEAMLNTFDFLFSFITCFTVKQAITGLGLWTNIGGRLLEVPHQFI